ncbi:hypothetical protein AB1N83_014353 [Pleurotus pulmonarius]
MGFANESYRVQSELANDPDADATYVWSGTLTRRCDLLAKDCICFGAALLHGTPYMYILIQKNHGYSMSETRGEESKETS